MTGRTPFQLFISHLPKRCLHTINISIQLVAKEKQSRPESKKKVRPENYKNTISQISAGSSTEVTEIAERKEVLQEMHYKIRVKNKIMQF